MSDDAVVSTAPQAAPAAPVPAAPAIPAEGTPTPAQNQTDAAPVDGEQSTTEKPADPPKPPGQSRFDRKIDRLHRERAEERAKRELYERQLSDPAYLEQRLGQIKPKAPVPGAPRLEDFSDIEEYAKAKAKHESERTLKEHEQKQRTQAQQAQQQRLI